MTKSTPHQTQSQPAPAGQAAAGAPAAPQASKSGISPSQAADKIKGLMAPKQAGAGAEAAQQPPAKAAQDKIPPQPKKPKKDGSADKGGKSAPQAGDELDAEGGASAEDDADGTDAETEADAGAADDGDNDGAETDGADDDADGDTSDDDAGDGEDETLHTVIVGGKEYEVSYEELVAGYQRAADYTQKTQALAKERKEIEALKAEVADLPERQKEYQQSAERFTNNAQLVLAALETRFMPQPPSLELAKADPAAYLEQKERHQEALQFRGALQHELKQFEERAKAEHQRAVEAGRVKLYEAIPEMKDQTARQNLRAYANSLGFSDEQIAMEANHVLFVCVEKARRWDELQKSKANLKDKKPLPKVVKRSNAQKSHKVVQERQKEAALDAHKQQGTVNSAADAIKAKLMAR